MKSPKTAKIQPWTPTELRLHKQAARHLEQVLKQAIVYIKSTMPNGRQGKTLTEEQLYKFIIGKMQQAGLTSVLNWVIVAYGPSAANPHYQFKPGKSRLLKPGHFLLIDLWGKLNRPDAPYADITHMYFVGKRVPDRFQKLWHNVKTARDQALVYIKQHHTAHSFKFHGIVTNHLDRCGHQGQFIHGLGHDLGHDHPHGPGINLNSKSHQPLMKNRGYTIEPGIYKKGQFGLRSEINFFLNKKGVVQVTTKIQQKLECI